MTTGVKKSVTRAGRIRDLLKAHPHGLTTREIKHALKLREDVRLLSQTLSDMRARGQLISIADDDDLRAKRWAFNGIPKFGAFNTATHSKSAPRLRMEGEPETVDEFLQRGGAVEHVEPGISGVYALKTSPNFDLDARRRPETPLFPGNFRRIPNAG